MTYSNTAVREQAIEAMAEAMFGDELPDNEDGAIWRQSATDALDAALPILEQAFRERWEKVDGWYTADGVGVHRREPSCDESPACRPVFVEREGSS